MNSPHFDPMPAPQARAFWAVAAGVGAIRTEALGPIAPDRLRIRTIATGVSRGTESLVFAGRVPESQHAAMRAPLMGGDFPFPVKYGYCAVGTTEDGNRVFVLHPHQDIFDAPAAMCVPIPDALPSHRAAFEGRIVEASWYGDRAPSVPLGEAFHARRLRLIASQVGAVAPAMRGRRSYAQRLTLALELLADPAYDALLGGPTAFEMLPDAMPAILAPGGLCHVITYGNG